MAGRAPFQAMLNRRLLPYVALVGVGVLLFTLPAFGAPREGAEYEVKAVFLLNFTRFVEWPADGGNAGQPFVIAVIGEDPFGARLDEVLRGEKLGDRPLVVKRVATVEQAGSCGTLFISRSEKPRLEKILNQVAGRPVLTVSDIQDFAEAGGMVELVTEESKIRFHIKVDASKAANLAISAKLLRPAVIVKTRKTSQHSPATPRSRALLITDRSFGAAGFLRQDTQWVAVSN